jgi:hypothetical protein
MILVVVVEVVVVKQALKLSSKQIIYGFCHYYRIKRNKSENKNGKFDFI